MKKNHYEENLFRFEDQRYEIDIVLENFKFVVDSLENLKQKLENEKIEQLNLEQLTHEIGKNNVTFITRFYQTYSNKIIQSLLSHPKKTIDIILNRFNKRIEEKQNQKEETEKNNKSSFDRFYSKSFDYRSFKFKNFDKKNNNAKAFLKEVLNRKKDKLTTSNSNVLKGGTDNSEFFTTLNLKYQDDDLLKKTKNLSNPILLNNINLDSMRKKLPELKIIFDNIDILKLTIAMIYYQIYNSNNIDTGKINEYFNPLFLNLFGFELTKLTDNLKNNNTFINDKNLNYSEVIENIKKRRVLSESDYNKFYQLDNLAKTIEDINLTGETLDQKDNSDNNSSIEQISLTPSLQTQDNGKTFRDVITFNIENNNSDYSNSLFYPPKQTGDVMFYANEHCFVFIRYIFCIYERLNKLNEYSTQNENTLLNNENEDGKNIDINELKFQIESPDSLVFKNYIIIYKAFLHKKVIENSTIYEELCREILSNESYFLFNMDKLISSLIKTMNTIITDNLSKEILNLFKFEITRKQTPNEKLYFANYIQLLGNNSANNFRILYNPKLNIMTIHLMELPIEQNKKDYYSQFKDFVNKTLQASYQKMYNDNQSTDDPFNIYLKRNKKIMKKIRVSQKPAYVSNNLIFRFDYANKKLQYLKSDCDILLQKKGQINNKNRVKTIINKNLSFQVWINNIKDRLNKI